MIRLPHRMTAHRFFESEAPVLPMLPVIPSRVRACMLPMVLTFLAAASGASNVPFSPSQAIGSIDEVDAIRLADLDGDGDLDVVTSSLAASAVHWFENTSGDGSTWAAPQVILEHADGLNDVAVGDLDGDGDLDVVGTVDFGPGRTIWAENTAGDGSAWTQRNISTAFFAGTGTDVGDINGDGSLDVLAAGTGSDRGLRWLRNNNGLGTSWSSLNIHAGLNAQSVVAVDLDRDGDVDALGTSSFGNEVAFLENTAGDGSAWTEHGVSAIRGSAQSAESADVDGDGDLDVLFSSTSDNLFAWAENTAGDGTAWTERVIDMGATSPVDVRPADLDMDGDIDLVAADAAGFIVDWYENTAGDGSAWTQRSINADTGATRAVFVGDVDGDGDPDMVGTDFADDEIVWWENLTLHRSAVFPIEIGVSSSFVGARGVDAADVDGDGNLDVLGVADDDDLTWWQNTAGDGSAWTARTIRASFNGGRTTLAVDLDRDGDLDTLASSNVHGTLWWENTAGDGTAWTERAIDTTLGVTQGTTAADIDGDGDPDVVSAGAAVDSIAWFDNTSGDGTTWSKTTVDSDFDGAYAVTAVDLDGDGDSDILATAELGDDVSWWENTAGDGTAWTEHGIDLDVDGPRSILAADLDGDGDLDVVATAFEGDSVSWWENTTGDGTAWIEHLIDGGVDGAQAIDVVDLDADGDLDVLAAAELGDSVTWWENSAGDGTAWAAHGVTSGFDGAQSVRAADLDGDGDVDVLGAAESSDDIAWWQNLGGQFALPTFDAVTQSDPAEGQTDVLLLRIDATHRGRSGDDDLELVTFELLFEESAADPLSEGELDALVSVLRIYRDDGDGLFETDGSDANFHSVAAPFTLASGVLTTTFVDGEPDVQVAVGTDETYFVAADLQADASSAPVTTLRLTHLTSSSSTAEMQSTDIPLSLEYHDDTSAFSITAQLVPDITVTPSQLDFGNQALADGATTGQTVMITNDGSADLTITSLALAGTDAAEFAILADSGEATLAPGATRVVDIVFDPSVVGAKTAVLRILSNDFDEAMVDVDLEGTGIEPEITVAPATVDFGDQLVREGAGAARAVTITNDGSDDLEIISVGLIGTDAGDFAVITDSGESTLAPGAIRTVDIVFDPSAIGARTAALRIHSTDADEATVDVALIGTGVEPEISVTPLSVDFGLRSTTSGATAAQTVTLANDGNGDLTITSVTLTGADAGEFVVTADSAETTLAPDEMRILDIAFDPSSIGVKTATLRILSTDDDEATVDVDLIGAGVDTDIFVSPAAYDFGDWSITATTPATEPFTFTNAGADNLSITSMSITGADAGDFTIAVDSSEAILPPGGSRTVAVAFDPSSVGAKSAALRLISDAATLDTALAGIGTEPEISIAPLLLDAGAQPIAVGPAGPQTVAITNDGNAALAISSVVIAGTDAADFTITDDSGEAVLLPGATRTVDVAFDPSTNGIKAATLRVISDDPDKAILGVALDGVGTAPEITVGPFSLDFGSIDVDGGPSDSQTVTITNDGTAPLSIAGVQLSGDGSDEFTITGDTGDTTLGPGESRTVDLAFDPISSGIHSAVLEILSDDADEAMIQVELSGNSADLIFYDGFESGVASAWSQSQP